jgi:Domain of unknown function (DUF4333)
MARRARLGHTVGRHDEHRSQPVTRLCHAAVAGTLVVVASACATGSRLDMADLKRRLEEQMRERVPAARAIEAECPKASSVRVDKGVSFRCTVSVDGRRLLVTLTQIDDQGHVDSSVEG